jgi:xeroderma pigmentosum group C-complementing protein
MLPIGAVHVKDEHAIAVARKLKIGYAKAIISFSFSAQGTYPQFEGIVIAEENEMAMGAGLVEHTKKVIEDEEKKREERVNARWKKLVVGYLSRERLHRDYLN